MSLKAIYPDFQRNRDVSDKQNDKTCKKVDLRIVICKRKVRRLL